MAFVDVAGDLKKVVRGLEQTAGDLDSFVRGTEAVVEASEEIAGIV